MVDRKDAKARGGLLGFQYLESTSLLVAFERRDARYLEICSVVR